MITDTYLRALRYLTKHRVLVSNDGTTSDRNVSAPAYRALRAANLVVLNGASRGHVKGRMARRVIPTSAGLDLITK